VCLSPAVREVGAQSFALESKSTGVTIDVGATLAFEYYTAPRVLGLVPCRGSFMGGTTVSVRGAGFVEDGLRCSFGGVAVDEARLVRFEAQPLHPKPQCRIPATYTLKTPTPPQPPTPTPGVINAPRVHQPRAGDLARVPPRGLHQRDRLLARRARVPLRGGCERLCTLAVAWDRRGGAGRALHSTPKACSLKPNARRLQPKPYAPHLRPETLHPTHRW
jgi:hypothetical protein